MPKPTVLPRWASGAAAVVEPASGKKDVGWLVGERPPAQYENWRGELVYDWLNWIDPLLTTNGGISALVNEHITVSGTGRFKHGDLEATLPAIAGNATANWTLIDDAPNGAYYQSAAAAQLWVPIPTIVGQRIKTVSFVMRGDGVADCTVDVYIVTPTGVGASIGQQVMTNPGGAFATTTINVTDSTIATGETAFIRFNANAAQIQVRSIKWTYDFP